LKGSFQGLAGQPPEVATLARSRIPASRGASPVGADAGVNWRRALVALGDNAPEHEAGYERIGSAAGFDDDWQAGLDPAGSRLRIPSSLRAWIRSRAVRLSNYLGR
jgi:hypothetical protein